MLQEQQEADREEKPRHNPDSSPAQFLGARDEMGSSSSSQNLGQSRAQAEGRGGSRGTQGPDDNQTDLVAKI